MNKYTPEMAGSGQYGECEKCGLMPTKEGHDGCIGTLPSKDVMNACCGHGKDSQAYVQFWNKPRIGGVEAMEYISAESLPKDGRNNGITFSGATYHE